MGIPFFNDNDEECVEPTYWRGFGLIGNDLQYNLKAHLNVQKKEIDPNENTIKNKLLKRYRQIYSNYQKKAILGILSPEEYKKLTENDYCGVDFHELFDELRGINNDNKKDILDPTRSDFDINNYYKLINESNAQPANDVYNKEMYEKIEKLVDEGKVEEEMLYQLNKTFKNYEDYKENTYKLKRKALLLTPPQCVEKVKLIGNEIYRLLYEMNGGNVKQSLAILTRLNNMKQFFGHLGELTDEQIEVISRRGINDEIMEHVVRIYYKHFALPFKLSEGLEELGPYQPHVNEQNLGELVCPDAPEKDLGIEPIKIDKYYGISLSDIFKVPDIHIELKELIPAPSKASEQKKNAHKIPEHFEEDVLSIMNS